MTGLVDDVRKEARKGRGFSDSRHNVGNHVGNREDGRREMGNRDIEGSGEVLYDGVDNVNESSVTY